MRPNYVTKMTNFPRSMETHIHGLQLDTQSFIPCSTFALAPGLMFHPTGHSQRERGRHGEPERGREREREREREGGGREGEMPGKRESERETHKHTQTRTMTLAGASIAGSRLPATLAGSPCCPGCYAWLTGLKPWNFNKRQLNAETLNPAHS